MYIAFHPLRILKQGGKKTVNILRFEPSRFVSFSVSQCYASVPGSSWTNCSSLWRKCRKETSR